MRDTWGNAASPQAAEPNRHGMTLRVDTPDAGAARVELSERYCPHELSPVRGSGGFHARQFEGGAEQFRVFRLSFGEATTLVDPVPFEDFVLLSSPTRGTYSVSDGERTARLHPGQAIALDPETSYRMRWEDDCEVLTIRLDRFSVESAIAGVTGARPKSIRFPVEAPPPPLVLAWNLITRFLSQEAMSTNLLETAPLVRGELVRLLIAAVLQAHPATIADLGASRPGYEPSATRLAMDFMEAHAAEDIGLAEIAAAARLSPRALQEAFRRQLDTTPIAFLRDARLRRAHQDLQLATPEETVTVAAVATRWGFAHLGRFATAYRKTYGRSPSETLRAG